MKRVSLSLPAVMVIALSLGSACSTRPPARLAATNAALQELVQPGGVPQTILVVVAHPDDENMMGPALSRLAHLGHTVRVIIATDGKYGTRVTDAPPEVLGPIRRKESECALEALGLPPPAFLSIDRLDTRNGVRSYLNGHKHFLSELRAELQRTRPTAIITFGPDGEYGHSEHIVVGASVTELLLKDGLVHSYPLYYFGWTKEQTLGDEDLSYVDARYFTHKLNHTVEDEMRYVAAARCFTSQFTAAEMDEMARLVSSEHPRVSYFRRFYAPPLDAHPGTPEHGVSAEGATRR